MIRFACPTCKAALKVPPERAGKVLPCPRCDDKIKIPMKSEVEDAQARPAPSAARTLPRPKPKPSDEVIDNGFEVVEDEPKPRPKLKPKPAAQEEEDFEVIEEKPRAKSRRVADEDDEEDRPVRKKKKKKRRRSSGDGLYDLLEDDNKAYMIYLGVGIGTMMVTGMLSQLVPAAIYAHMIVGLLALLFNLPFLVRIVYREGGLLPAIGLFIPGISLIVNLVFLRHTWKPFLFTFMISFAWGFFIGLAKDERGNFKAEAPLPPPITRVTA